MGDWIIKKSADDDSYFLLQKDKIYIWFQEVKIDGKHIWFYDRKLLIACYLKNVIPKNIIDDLKTLPQIRR